MKTTKCSQASLFGLALMTLVLASSLSAQNPARSKGLELESTGDALNVQIFKTVRNNGQLTKIEPAINPADPALSFSSGELITVAYSINFDGYVYFINVGPEGTRVIFPGSSATIQPIKADLRREATLRLNNKTGREELLILISHDRIANLDAAISRPDKMLDATTTALPADPQVQSGPTDTVAQPAAEAAAVAPTAAPAVAANQLAATASPVKKTSKMKRVGIVAGGIGLSILSAWVGIRLPGSALATAMGGVAGQLGVTLTAPAPTVDPNAVAVANPTAPADTAAVAANPAAAPKPAAPAKTAKPVSRGLELETDDNNVIRATPTDGAKLGAGQLAAFRISFDHK